MVFSATAATYLLYTELACSPALLTVVYRRSGSISACFLFSVLLSNHVPTENSPHLPSLGDRRTCLDKPLLVVPFCSLGLHSPRVAGGWRRPDACEVGSLWHEGYARGVFVNFGSLLGEIGSIPLSRGGLRVAGGERDLTKCSWWCPNLGTVSIFRLWVAPGTDRLPEKYRGCG